MLAGAPTALTFMAPRWVVRFLGECDAAPRQGAHTRTSRNTSSDILNLSSLSIDTRLPDRASSLIEIFDIVLTPHSAALRGARVRLCACANVEPLLRR